jgi:hypothetical protein
LCLQEGSIVKTKAETTTVMMIPFFETKEAIAAFITWGLKDGFIAFLVIRAGKAQIPHALHKKIRKYFIPADYQHFKFCAILKRPEIKGFGAFFLLFYMENGGSSAL